MNWKLVSNQKAAIQEYHLIDNDASCKLILKYNPLHRSARISCGVHNRLFFIEKAGQLSTKTFFKDQYGMDIGNLTTDKWSDKKGTIVIDDTKYTYKVEGGPQPELTIYDANSTVVLMSCAVNNGTNSFAGTADNNCLLLSLCWFLLLPIAKDAVTMHAA